MSTPLLAGTGLKGKPVADLIQQFFGKLERWPLERDGSTNHTQANIIRICERMSETGDCLWHACSVVYDKVAICVCAQCKPGPPRPPKIVRK